MKKITFALILIGLLLAFVAFSYGAEAKIFRGMRGEEIRVIQEILKEDPKIYPEGYVTGYFGPLTSKAIKRLQKRCKIPETGVIDKATEKCIYPIEYEIKVLYPNGGEILDRNQIQTIKWEVKIALPSGKEIRPSPFWKKASIDLFKRVKVTLPCLEGETCKVKEKSIFVKHIATVNLFDQAYSWKITPDIKNGGDYVIRISVGPGVGLIWYREKTKKPLPPAGEIWPSLQKVAPILRHISWDESDGTFEITGVIPPKPVKNLDQVIAILEKIAQELQKAIALLKEMAQ